MQRTRSLIGRGGGRSKHGNQRRSDQNPMCCLLWDICTRSLYNLSFSSLPAWQVRLLSPLYGENRFSKRGVTCPRSASQ